MCLESMVERVAVKCEETQGPRQTAERRHEGRKSPRLAGRSEYLRLDEETESHDA
jgi:hypothetical protein